MAGRTYKELKNDSYGFVRIAKQVTYRYAETQKEYSQAQVAEEFDLSESCVRKLMDYAIVNSLVPRITAQKVMNKSIENQQRKHPEAGGTSITHHQKLILERDENIAQKMNKERIKFIVESAVALDRNQPYSDLVKALNLESMKVLQFIFERAIVENIATETETMHLINRSLLKNNSKELQNYFNELVRKRQEFRKSRANKDSG